MENVIQRLINWTEDTAISGQNARSQLKILEHGEQTKTKKLSLDIQWIAFFHYFLLTHRKWNLQMIFIPTWKKNLKKHTFKWKSKEIKGKDCTAINYTYSYFIPKVAYDYISEKNDINYNFYYNFKMGYLFNHVTF